jgi:hypothetical protein
VESPADELRRLADDAQRAAVHGVEQLRAWLATPAGRRFRKNAARVLLLASPLLFRARFFRVHPLGRLIELAGGATLVIKLAETIREWEPEPAADWGPRPA